MRNMQIFQQSGHWFLYSSNTSIIVGHSKCRNYDHTKDAKGVKSWALYVTMPENLHVNNSYALRITCMHTLRILRMIPLLIPVIVFILFMFLRHCSTIGTGIIVGELSSAWISQFISGHELYWVPLITARSKVIHNYPSRKCMFLCQMHAPRVRLHKVLGGNSPTPPSLTLVPPTHCPH